MADPRMAKDVDDNAVLKNGSFVPEVDNNKDLGRSTKQWKDVYLKGSLKNATGSRTIAQIVTDAAKLALIEALADVTADHAPQAHAPSHNAAGGDVLALTISSTNTLTNKRITKRTNTIVSSATPTPAGDTTDVFTITALAVGATFAAPTGTPTNGQSLLLRIKDNGTAQTLAYNAIYREGDDIKFPTTTIAGKTMYVALIYNSTDVKYDLVGVVMGI